MPSVYRQADQLVKREGWPCLWYRSSLSVSARYDGTVDYTATDSDGRGYIHETARSIPVLFTSHSQDERFDMAGSWASGRCSGTIRVANAVKNQDRIVPTTFPMADNFIQTRSAASTDTVRSRYLVTIESIRDSDTVYTKGTDYQLVSNASTGVSIIEWLGGGLSPTAGANYSVVCTFRPIWVVNNHPMIRALDHQQLPWRVELIRDDVSVRGA